jgi:hypothetical protein
VNRGACLSPPRSGPSALPAGRGPAARPKGRTS